MKEITQQFFGILYLSIWNCSIFAGYLLFIPFTVLQLFVPKLYRFILDVIITYWQYFITILLYHQNCHVKVTGDPINSEEIALIISNHRTRVDWNFLWAVMFHAVEGKNWWWYSTKFVLKNSIRNIPGAGWVMQMAMYIFIKRNWERDKPIFDSYINYVKEMDYKHALLLFPEGTDLTPQTMKSSNRYAEKHGLSKFNHVLHPRYTGFIYLVQEMRKKKCLDAVYDITLIYPDECPQNEEELFLKGKIPHTVFAHIIKYPISVLPEDKDELKEFLEKRWIEKENTIEEFKISGNYLHDDKSGHNLLNKDYYLTYFFSIFTFLSWMGLLIILLICFIKNTLYFYTVLLYTACLYLSPIFMQKSIYEMRKSIFSCVSRYWK